MPFRPKNPSFGSDAYYDRLKKSTAKLDKQTKSLKDFAKKSSSIILSPQQKQNSKRDKVYDGEFVNEPIPARSSGKIQKSSPVVNSTNNKLPQQNRTTPQSLPQFKPNTLHRGLIPTNNGVSYQRTGLRDAMDKVERKYDKNSLKNRVIRQFTNRDYWHKDIKPTLERMFSTLQR